MHLFEGGYEGQGGSVVVWLVQDHSVWEEGRESIPWQGLLQSREGPSNKDFHEVYQAWVLVELLL